MRPLCVFCSMRLLRQERHMRLLARHILGKELLHKLLCVHYCNSIHKNHGRIIQMYVCSKQKKEKSRFLLSKCVSYASAYR